jgi:branched-chain amino acid transport system ATP-binding protein
MAILETHELSKHFGGLIAVNKVSMRVEKGEIVGLIGPNGAGKTTLLNAIAGQNPPTSGKIIFNDKDTTGLTPEKMCKRGLSRTFQIPQPFPQMPAIQNVLCSTLFGNKKKIKDPMAHSRAMLEYVEFPMDEQTITANLNTVQLKRLDLARALASRPRLLFMDEMASGLTEGELNDIIKLILKVRDSGITILMVEHIMKLIMNVCDRLVVIQFGSKIAEGPTKEVAQDPKVTKAYLGSCR